MKGPRVLLVDDDQQILKAFATALRDAGFEVETAETAAGALAAAAAAEPDVVVLDLLLPDGNGTDVCPQLKARIAAPVLMLSAVDEEHEKEAAFEAGAVDYLTKPIGLNPLLARLSRLHLAPAGSHTVR